MTYNTGDNVELSISTGAIGSSGSIYSYVWRFWDATTQVGTQPYTDKAVNLGGDPLNGNRLIYECFPTMVDGTSGSLYGTLVANNPPFLLDATISKNDDYYSYQTTLALKAYSLEGHALTFQWFEGTTSLDAAAPGSASGAPVARDWRGNGIVSSVPAVQSYVSTKVLAVRYDRVITCKVTDTTTNVVVTTDFRLRGKVAPPLWATMATETSSTTTDATSMPLQRIGLDQFVTFVAYVTDISGIRPAFQWDFSQANGWTVYSTYFGSNGTNVTLPDGSFSSTITKDVSTEVVSFGPAKVATAVCRITGTNNASLSFGKVTEVRFSVALLKNNPPSSITITCKRTDGTVVDLYTDSVDAGTKLIYEAVATDLDLDVITASWRIDGYPFPSPMYAYGPKIVVDTTGYVSGARIQGQATVTDRMGPPGGVQSLSFTGPKIN